MIASASRARATRQHAATIAATLAAAALTCSVAVPASAADEAPEPRLTFSITSNEAAHPSLAAGQEWVFDYEVRNDTGADLAVPADATVAIAFTFDFATDPPEATDCDLSLDGFGEADDGLSVYEWAMALPDTIPSGTVASCTIAYTPSAVDIASGGLWTMLQYRSTGGWAWDYSQWAIVTVDDVSPMPTVAADPASGLLSAEPGFWGPRWGGTFTYQWLRDGQAIAGATGATYAPVAADSGHDIAVAVTLPTQGVTKTSAAVPTALEPFTATSRPTVTGTTLAGKNLTARTGSWSPAPTFSYQWLRDGATIAGATSKIYTLTEADRGKTIKVRVTAAKSGYATVTKTSAGTYIPRVFASTPRPVVKGSAVVGATVRAATGTWKPTPTFGFRWLRDGKPISGATSKTYIVRKIDKGKKIKVQVIAQKSGYLTTVKTSSTRLVS
ncbi:hypothetical protein [Demequina silvatica]|uniref:hypothetical protein n=1 Tax=Demequina silvatica TaxID=1638988 RepID=UPI000782B4B4|nr:hypothetical protein [Demequina silvatica]